MRRGHILGRRIGIVVGLWAVAMAAGCHQHYYVMNPASGTFVATPPASYVGMGDVGGTVAYGDACTVPQGTVIGATTPVSGPVVVSSSVPGSPTTQPYMVSQPTARNGWFGNGFRSWRPTPEPSRIAIQAEGAYTGDGTVVR